MLLSEKEKVLTLVYPGPYAHKKLNFCLSAKFNLRLKKTTINFGAISKLLGNIFVLRSKNASHTISTYANCMISIVFENKHLGFFITRLFCKNQTAAEFSLYLVSTIVRKLYDKHCSMHSMYEVL